jgi:uncharacterized protein YrrD
VKKYSAISIILSTFFILSSCSATQPSPLVEALLEQPSVNSRLILESAIGELLNSQPIKLADNVFLEKSTVIIGYQQSRNSRNNLLNGREIRQADSVSLLTKSGKCYLKHNRSEDIKLIGNISCRSIQN